jgi:multidrug efflux pump subunit AcrB
LPTNIKNESHKMNKIILFFLNNTRINYSIFLLLIAIGIYTGFKISKEIFPRFELDMITISGGYSGASIDMIDLSVASSIEDNIKNINGIKSLSSSITSGRFSIMAELKKNTNKNKVLEDIKDGVNLAKPTFPSDMNDPIVRAVTISRNLARVAITSDVLSIDKLVEISKKLQEELLTIKGIYEADIVGDSEFFYEINIDEKRIETLNISHNSLFSAISKLSYIFPVGKIEDTKQVYLSTANGKKSIEEFASTLLNIQGKTFRLLDVAQIKRKHSDKSRLFTYNLKPSISISIKQAENSNAMNIVQNVKKILAKKSNKNVQYILYDDNSTIITERLNMVTSSIIFGIILLFITMSFLINMRMAIIITLGIPVAFLFTIMYFYFFGFSINLISLIGLLIATGIIVDDAIVISENIQRYIEEGKSATDAAIDGVSELIKPISIASLTTIFAFLPSLMISGTMGKFIQLIPIAVSMTLLASLLEVFLFLPLHAKHILSVKSKSLSWELANNFYLKIIKFLFLRKKLFLVFFIILTPILTVVLLKQTSFQLFPKFDSANINISIMANKNTKLEDSFKIVREIEKDIMTNKEKWGISTISSTAGFRLTNARTVKRSPNSMYIRINLYDLIPKDSINLYIIPALSIFKTDRKRIRKISSSKLSLIFIKYINENGYKE